jgi:hypothetical protein
MNVIRIYGGIGNQMFQYAFGRAMMENGIEVGFDISWMEERELLKQPYPRPRRLEKFQTKLNIMRFMPAPTVREHYMFGRRGEIGFDLGLLKMDNYNFDGYWQYLSYFEHLLPELKEELRLKPEVYTDEFLELRNKIRNCESVSVHVRRGDYLTHKGNFRDLVFRYYFDAISLTEGDLFIFSDDIPWCKRNFIPDFFDRNITFIHLEDYLDFELMRECKTNITTNSTFSYWAALLNDNPDKKVICPQYWLMERDINDLHYPKDWIKIEDYVI